MDVLDGPLLAAAVGIQFPIALLIHLDAKRLGLERPETYSLGVLVPAAGFVVIGVYLSRRSELPRAQA